MAGNAAKQQLLIAVCHVVFRGQRISSVKEPLLPTKSIFATVAVIRTLFVCGVERVKRFVTVHLHFIVSSLKRISKMSTFPL